ncbi:Patatin-like protein 6 [Linum perenne]
MVDQAMSMAFGECRERNYFRIQGNGNCTAMLQTPRRGNKIGDLIEAMEGKLEHKNVESVLFKGKKMGQNTNLEKLGWVSGEVIKEGKRKRSVLPAVVLKQEQAHAMP